MAYIKYLLISCFFFACTFGFTQTKLNSSGKVAKNPLGDDTTAVRRSKAFKKLASIDMYLVFNKENDTSIVDTTLSIKKEYKFNYLRKDNFNYISFANIGQTYNTLSFDVKENLKSPIFGARARHFNYYEAEDIKYYEVPTPWTRLIYKTAFKQGQLLDAFIAVNLSKQFNYSIGYKGLRSLGNYQHALTSTGNFRFTANYITKNERYKVRGHVVMQDLLNEENGGLKDSDLANFESGIPEFRDRAVFDPNFENAENILVGKRYYLDHAFKIIEPKDSLSQNSLSITNKISYQKKYYEFKQDATATDFFGDAFTNVVRDKVALESFYSDLGLKYRNDLLGSFYFSVDYTNINYGYNSVVIFPNEIIPNRIKTDFLGINATYAKNIGGIGVFGSGGINLSQDFFGNYLDVKIDYQLNDDIYVKGGLNLSSRLPNYNFLLFQSDYINYNWYNFENFENISSQQLNFEFQSDKYLTAKVDVSNIDNYTFFNLENLNDKVKVIKPKQYSKSLQYFRIKIEKEIKVGNFALDNTIMYQNVVSDEKVLNVPDFVTRNTLYYSNQIFKKAMTLQTGVIFNYFTKYNMNGYDPLLAEFYTQNETELGGFPRLDFFINAKIRQTRIFFKAEHFNSSFTGYNFYSAPNNPYRDFTIRFGIVWDFFL